MSKRTIGSISLQSSLASAWILVLGCVGASAATTTITCDREDVVVVGWNGPVTITYEGAEAGTLKVKSATFEMSIPSAMQTQDGMTSIRGSANTKATMPDLGALESCIAKKIAPADAGDKDAYLSARDSCLSGTPPGKAAIAIAAYVNIAIMPGQTPEVPDVQVEIKRTYVEKTSAPGGTTGIDTFPAQCHLGAK